MKNNQNTDKEIINAKIKQLRWFNKPAFTQWIEIEGDVWGCSFGGYRLTGERAYKWIIALMKVLDLSSFSDSDAEGKIIRCVFKNNKIVAIGHPYKDIWLSEETIFGEKI